MKSSDSSLRASTSQAAVFNMAGDKVPTLQSLEKPEKLQDVLRQDRGDDCLGCKIIGQ